MDGYRSFVVADIPGLIEGAHKGHGLGDQFLKHVERTKVLAHLLDVSQTGRNPIEDYKVVTRELSLFNNALAERKQLVVASKLDAMDDRRKLARIKAMCTRRGLPFIAVSAVTGEGIPELIHTLAKMLEL